MKINLLKPLRPWLSFSLACVGVSATASAGTFQYNPSDLLIGVRTTPSAHISSSYELLINGGNITNYLNLTTGQSITISNVAALLPGAFADLNDISFAAFADVYTSLPGYPENTLWVTRPRADFNAQSSPWSQLSDFALGPVLGHIEYLGSHALTYGSSQPAGIYNTNAAIGLPPGDALVSYSASIGANGNFKQTFTGNVEQGTGSIFSTGGQNVRSDFYALLPYTPATYLGYFELSTSGDLKYTAGPSPIVATAAQILNITRSGVTTVVTFGPTVTGTTYSLYSSADLLTPLASWSLATSAPGTTAASMTLNDTSSADQKFYIIKAQ